MGLPGSSLRIKLPLWESENPGSFRLKSQFQYTHTKEVKSKMYYFEIPEQAQ